MKKTIAEIQKKYRGLPGLDLELMLSEAAHKERMFICSHPEYALSLLQYLKLRYFLYDYKKGCSVAAIIGRKEFLGLDFIVNKHVLIPRPDTELMAESAIEEIKKMPDGGSILTDIGTGSGCIPVSIGIKFPDLKIFASDISRAALRVAEKNAEKHNVKITFLHGDLLKPVIGKIRENEYLIITANLPYLTQKQYDLEPSITKEPKTALVADNQNGLFLYEKLLRQISQLKNRTLIFLEMDPRQTAGISKLVKKYFPQSTTGIKKDLSGRDRLVFIRN